MSRLMLSLAFRFAVLPLLNCGGSQHSPEEKYVLIATNVKVPYWREAAAGIAKAALQLQFGPK